MRVALFITCFNDTLFPETGRATVELLERLGHEVEFPREQTCCGQMHFNTGYQREAYHWYGASSRYSPRTRPSSRLPLRASVWFASSTQWRRTSPATPGSGRGSRRSPQVFELSEFLVGRLGVTDVGAYYPHRVTYHPTCHSLRMLKVGDAPLALLRAVRGIDLVELTEAEVCCGFGGTFAVKNADTSAAMLSDKIRRVLDTEAEVCAAGDNSCLMHIGGGLRRLRAGVRTVHLAEILAGTRDGHGG